jgi:hypothetical protein
LATILKGSFCQSNEDNTYKVLTDYYLSFEQKTLTLLKSEGNQHIGIWQHNQGIERLLHVFREIRWENTIKMGVL